MSMLSKHCDDIARVRVSTCQCNRGIPAEEVCQVVRALRMCTGGISSQAETQQFRHFYGDER